LNLNKLSVNSNPTLSNIKESVEFEIDSLNLDQDNNLKQSNKITELEKNLFD
jgi:hypothetical protein